MSECVVRMEMPKNCFECPFSIIDDTADGAWCNTLGKQVYYDRDEDCPIICQLPEGHGTLIDLETAAEGLSGRYNSCHMTCGAVMQFLDELPTIVPAKQKGAKHEH